MCQSVSFPLIPMCNSGDSMVDVDYIEGCVFQTETVSPSLHFFVDEVARGLYGSHIVEHCRRENTSWNELVRPLHGPKLHRYRPFPFPRVQVS